MEKTEIDGKRKLLNMLGLAMKAGRLAFGTDRVTDAVRSGRSVRLVITASDISDNTGKRVRNCCEYYQTECLGSEATGEEIGRAIGKLCEISTVAVLDRHFAEAVAKLLNKQI